MSHFTRVRTRMVEKEYILKALEELGYHPEEGKAVKGWFGNRAEAEFKIPSKKWGFDIGFVRNGDAYEMVADWSVIRQHDFVAELTRRYAYWATRAKLEEQGFSLVSEESEKDGQVRLLVRRVV